ncbi:MAG: helix-turn-helix domain-containing protein [Terriglobales bacterium]
MTAKNGFDLSVEWRSLSADPLTNLSDVAKSLGVSRDSVRRYIRAGRLRAVRVGGRLKVRRSAALALLQEVQSYERNDDAKTLPVL